MAGRDIQAEGGKYGAVHWLNTRRLPPLPHRPGKAARVQAAACRVWCKSGAPGMSGWPVSQDAATEAAFAVRMSAATLAFQWFVAAFM